MTRTLLRSSLGLALFLALLLPGTYAAAGGGGTPLKLDIDGAAGFKGDTLSNHYEDGDGCAPVTVICVRIRLISGGKTFAFDTRNTNRSVRPSAVGACVLTGCTTMDGVVTHKGLLEVYIRENRATFWFSSSLVDHWRLDWESSVTTTPDPKTDLDGPWTVASDPTKKAKLYRLEAKGTRSKQIFAGEFTISLKFTAEPLP